MVSALVLLISKSDNKAECVVAFDANEVIDVGVLLYHYASRSLKSWLY
jgi:hypothetical protein